MATTKVPTKGTASKSKASKPKATSQDDSVMSRDEPDALDLKDLKVPDYPPPDPPVQNGLSRRTKWIAGIASALVLLVAGFAAWQIKSIDIPLISAGGGHKAITASQVEQRFTVMRSRRASNLARSTSYATSISINSENCQITTPGSALCAEMYTVSGGFGTQQQQSLSWRVSYNRGNGSILAYVPG